MERALIAQYKEMIGQACSLLSPANHDCAVQIAKLPDMIRGYGEVKRASVERYQARLAQLVPQLRTGQAR